MSRLPSVPVVEGWWNEFLNDKILAVDCEMVSKIIGRKNNGKPRCKQVAGKVVAVDYDGNTIYDQLVYHKQTDVYLTPIAKKITGFKRDTFEQGKELEIVQDELESVFKGKLLILINAGSDFSALNMKKGNFEVFDLHQFYERDTGKIGLRSLVHHFYNVDIQHGVHDPLVDAQYTMKIFREQYIPYKLQHPEEIKIRCGSKMFNEIPTFK